MADIQFEIQGQDAVAATEELLSTSGLTGDWTVAVEDKTSKEAVTTTVATIVGIVGGTIAIAEQIRKWYQDYKKGKAGKTINTKLRSIVVLLQSRGSWGGWGSWGSESYLFECNSV